MRELFLHCAEKIFSKMQIKNFAELFSKKCALKKFDFLRTKDFRTMRKAKNFFFKKSKFYFHFEKVFGENFSKKSESRIPQIFFKKYALKKIDFLQNFRLIFFGLCNNMISHIKSDTRLRRNFRAVNLITEF